MKHAHSFIFTISRHIVLYLYNTIIEWDAKKGKFQLNVQFKLLFSIILTLGLSFRSLQCYHIRICLHVFEPVRMSCTLLRCLSIRKTINEHKSILKMTCIYIFEF